MGIPHIAVFVVASRKFFPYCSRIMCPTKDLEVPPTMSAVCKKEPKAGYVLETMDTPQPVDDEVDFKKIYRR